jgi:transposase
VQTTPLRGGFVLWRIGSVKEVVSAMFLRRHKRKKSGAVYEYWTLVESMRTSRGPRQRTVATIGKWPGLDEEARVGWEQIGAILEGKVRQADLLESPAPDPPEWATVDIKGLSVERLRRFGEVYLGLALWRRLGLDRFFDAAMERGREEIAWSTMACILTLARFCAPSSELQVADFWYGKTALEDLLGVPAEKVNDDRLYRALDALLPKKDALFGHLQKTYGELFGTTFDILLYDITSTYFEGTGAANPQARRGYSRDKRPDCVQVCIALVVTAEGLPLTYEVFDGDRADVTTVEEIVETMREKYGHERRVWVMDRGMVSEDNLEELRRCKAAYLVATPKSMLKEFERELLDEDWQQIEPGVGVKSCRAPDNTCETFVLCRSPQRREKERAMRERQIRGLEDGLARLKARTEAPTRVLRNRDTANRRVGRLFQRYSRAAHLYTVTINEVDDPHHKSGKRLTVKIVTKDDLREWVEEADGCYLLRTNLEGQDAETLWRTYTGLTQIEDCFRIGKHDLGLRPIFHRKQDRTQAHILVCFLALVLWRTLQQWMESVGLGTAPRKLLEEMAEVRSLDIVLPTRTGQALRLRTVSRPEKHLAILLQRLGLPLPNKPKKIQNVVQTLAQKMRVSPKTPTSNL